MMRDHEDPHMTEDTIWVDCECGYTGWADATIHYRYEARDHCVGLAYPECPICHETSEVEWESDPY